eukprot:scaffold153998_cov28-Tisochrysis_lutea.AAC.1
MGASRLALAIDREKALSLRPSTASAEITTTRRLERRSTRFRPGLLEVASSWLRILTPNIDALPTRWAMGKSKRQAKKQPLYDTLRYAPGRMPAIPARL